MVAPAISLNSLGEASVRAFCHLQIGGMKYGRSIVPWKNAIFGKYPIGLRSASTSDAFTEPKAYAPNLHASESYLKTGGKI
jgi:hypothetical protein